MDTPKSMMRRRLLQATGGLALAGTSLGAWANKDKKIIVADPGGPYSAAYRKAFYDPFEKETGIRVVNVAREAQPVAQINAIVQTKNYIWDVTTLTLSADIPYLESQNLLEPLDITLAEVPGLIPEALTSTWLG